MKVAFKTSFRLILQNHRISCLHQSSTSSPLVKKAFSTISENNAEEAKITCWDCRQSTRKANSFCGSCRIIQPPLNSENAFEIFAMPQTFDLSQKLLDRQYRTLQIQLHPDKYAIKSNTEQDYATARSAEVNQAYQILSDPIERARLLLDLKGISIGKEAETIDDPIFLEAILEAREELEDLKSIPELRTLLDKHRREMNEKIRKISVAFSENQLDTVKKLVLSGIYLKELIQQIDHRLPL